MTTFVKLLLLLALLGSQFLSFSFTLPTEIKHRNRETLTGMWLMLANIIGTCAIALLGVP